MDAAEYLNLSSEDQEAKLRKVGLGDVIDLAQAIEKTIIQARPKMTVATTALMFLLSSALRQGPPELPEELRELSRLLHKLIPLMGAMTLKHLSDQEQMALLERILIMQTLEEADAGGLEQ